MSDDFGTVSIRRGSGAREIEALRERYRQHRDSLMRLVSGAPTEHLAVEYQRLVRDIDASLAKLDALEGRRTGEVPIPPATVADAPSSTSATAPPVVPPRTATPAREQGDPLRASTELETHPFISDPGESTVRGSSPDETPSLSSQWRMLLIAVAAIIVLGVIGALIWRASSDRKAESQQTWTASAVTETAPATITPVAPAPKTLAALVVEPSVVDFGNIAKGTRAARQLEIANNSTAPIAIEVSRSQCRCLYYEYAGQVAPKKKETITVTVDGARAKAGTLDETINVRAKKEPSITTNFQVTATVK